MPEPPNPAKRVKILAVAAWEPELVRLRERLVAAPLPPAAAAEVVLATLGVGLVEAAVGMTQRIEASRPDAAILLGTCGAFDAPPSEPTRGPASGAVVVGSKVTLVDVGTLTAEAELPPPMPSDATVDLALHDACVAAGARSVQIANTVGVTVRDELAARIAGTGSHVEHLEAFSFARACARANVPCAIVLGVANAVGARGREEWRAGHVAASAAAGDFVHAALPAIVRALRTSTRGPSPARA